MSTPIFSTRQMDVIAALLLQDGQTEDSLLRDPALTHYTAKDVRLSLTMLSKHQVIINTKGTWTLTDLAAPEFARQAALERVRFDIPCRQPREKIK